MEVLGSLVLLRRLTLSCDKEEVESVVRFSTHNIVVEAFVWVVFLTRNVGMSG